MNLTVHHSYTLSKSIAVLTILLLMLNDVFAQKFIEGYIYDAATQLPIPHASVLELETYETADTDSQGYFSIKVYDTSTTFYLSILHKEYETKELEFSFKQLTPIKIFLKSEQTFHNEVVVTGRRQKYSNKNNPAVDLIKKVSQRRQENDIEKIGIFQREQYEKLNVGVSRVPRFLTHNFILKPFRFVFDNYDSINYPGHKNLTIYLEENWSTQSINAPKNKYKKIIHHQKKISLDPNYINEEGTVAQVRHLYQNVNIYDNNLILVTNNFLSPIGTSSPQFYRFYITDTVMNHNGHRIVHLNVEPRNNKDLLLYGNIDIDIDNNYSVVRYEFETTKATNINFVDKVKISATYQLDPHTSKYYIDKYDNAVIFSLMHASNRKMIGSRSYKTSEFSSTLQLSDSIFTEPPTEIIKEHINNKADSTYYPNQRSLPFTEFEQRTYDNLDSMKNMRYFKNLIDWGAAITTGYKKVGKFDIGPFYRFYSYNDVDKHRIRFGMRTNPHAFKRAFASTYIAYSTGHKDFRYNLLGVYSIKNKPIYTYPMSYVRFFIQKDTKLQGRIGEVNVQDNLIETIQRGENDKFLLAKNYKLEFVQEFKNNFVVTSYAMFNDLSPRGSLYFTTGSSDADTIPFIRNAAIGVAARWSPGEIIYNDRTQRNRMHGKSPIFTLGVEKGFSGIYQSSIDYLKLSASITKRNLLGPLGILDYAISGHYIDGTVPYPLLNVPRANQTYTFSGQSYNMMNNGEFISDQQVELNINYRMMGFMFNKLPLIKHLRLREVAGVKMVYGHLSDRNNPIYNPQVLNFPVDQNNLAYIYQFQRNKPYIEWNVGIENIFSILRVDYVRRVNYLNNRQANKHGINISVIIDF